MLEQKFVTTFEVLYYGGDQMNSRDTVLFKRCKADADNCSTLPDY